MDQILVSVCCPPQNEHIDIKKLQIVMAANFPPIQPGGSQENISLITNSFWK